MGFFDLLKRKMCKHNLEIVDVQTEGMRKGTMVVFLICRKCGLVTETFHDITETEEQVFRNPEVEELLLKEGWLKEKNGKLKFHNKRK